MSKSLKNQKKMRKITKSVIKQPNIISATLSAGWFVNQVRHLSHVPPQKFNILVYLYILSTNNAHKNIQTRTPTPMPAIHINTCASIDWLKKK
jgi:hypothetical protein